MRTTHSRFDTARLAATIAIVLLGATGCSNAPERAADAASACAQLNGRAIPASVMSLPTGGASVTSAQLVPAVVQGPTAAGEYCKVVVAIHPVDPNAPQIRFQLDLPTAWNGKALMMGGGGYNGTIRDPGANVVHGAPDKPTPLARGYATWNSDSGHQAAPPYTGAHASLDGRFAILSEEGVRNFAGDFIQKTHDAVMYLAQLRFGRKPARTYFAGGSTGGREAFIAVQRFPQDFDGAIAYYPAWNAATLNLQFGRIARALAQPDAYPSVAKRNMLYDAVMNACDGLDGVRDGIISNVDACRFDPRTLRCPGGADTGDSCLSDAQVRALDTYATPIQLSYPLGSGEKAYPGFDVYGGIDTVGINPIAALLTLNTDQPRFPLSLNTPYGSQFWDMWIRYFVAHDPSLDSLQVDPERPGALQGRITELTGMQDVPKTDLSPFQHRGGKLLIVHGKADALVNVRATSEYYRRLVATMGQSRADEFVRYYEVPGFGHVFGKAFGASWDSLTALENWVERGVAPRDQVVTDTNTPTRGRTRPLCEYPGWPRYMGGDVNLASSFICAR
jgi:hypothetical protein